MSAIDKPTTNASAGAKRPITVIAAAALGGLLLLDAVVETFVAGSAMRWWVVGAAVLYAGATVSLFRLRVGWYGQLALAVFGVLGLVAVTAWAPGGLTDGVRFLGQPTSRVMVALAAAGVALAGLAVVRARALPLAARIGVGAIAAYGVLAFLVGAIDSAPLPALLAGQSLWQRVPTVLQGAFIGAFVVLPVGLVWSIVQAGLRRPRAPSLRADAWKIVALATSFATVLAGLPMRSAGAGAGGSAAAGLPSSPENYRALLGIDPKAPKPSQETLNTQLANSLRAIEDGQREMSRERWDLNYVLASLEYDPQRLFTWVQQNTFWIPYHGLLRGSVGVLMDRLGNSLDRAVLLALLLRQSGRTVRLAHGSLSTDQAMTLLPALLASRYTRAAQAIAPAVDQLPAIAARYQLDGPSLRRMMVAQHDVGARKRAQLLDTLADETKRLTVAVGSGPNAQVGNALERAIDALKDHWWVQVHEADAWQDFDLVKSSIGTALASSDKTIDLDGFPGELRHQVTVRVITEQWANGSLTERVALESVLRPTQLIGTPIVLRFLPTKWSHKFPVDNTNPEQSLRMLAMDQHEWTPALVVGKDATTQLTVRDTGDLISTDELRKASGGPVGGAMGGLTKRLDDALGGPTPAPGVKPSVSTILTSTSIEYEIQQPGEPPQKIRRMLFDLVGPAARAKKPIGFPKLDETGTLTRSLALMRETEILPIVCRFMPEYVSHLGAEAMLANRDILSAAVRGDLPGDLASAQDLANRLTPMPTRLYGLALARFAWSRYGNDIHVERLNLLTRHTFFAPAATSFKLLSATDIVANEMGVDLAEDNPFGIRLEQGVLDTNAEAILASSRPNASNAGSAFATSKNWTTLRTPGDPQLGRLQLPDDVRRRIADDLAAGYLVVAPTSPVPVGGVEFSGWWRVHPTTGQTLGMGDTGWGQEMVEALVVFAAEQALLAFLLTFIECTMSSSTPIAAQGTGCVTAAVKAELWGFLIGLLTGGVLAALGEFGEFGGASGARGGPSPKTEPSLGADPATSPYSNTLPGANPGAKTVPGGGDPSASPFGKTQPGSGGGGPSPGAGPSPGPGGNPGPMPAGPNGWWQPQPRSPELQAALDRMLAAEEKVIQAAKSRSGEFGQASKEFTDAAKEVGKLRNPEVPPPLPAPEPPPPGPGSGTSPTAPTQPANCAPSCPPSPHVKTLSGLGTALNALGQKGG